MNKVSILIPAYNCEDSIGKTIESCLEQTLEDIIVFIVNDCSTDNTLAVVEKFKDKRITTITLTKNSGKAAALNRAVDAVTTPYISIIDADDYYNPGFLEKAVEFLDNHDEYDMIYTDYETLLPDGVVRAKKALPQIDYYGSLKASQAKDPKDINLTYKVLSDQGFIPACSAVIKKEVFNKVRFDENCFIEDTDIWCQIAGKRFRIKYLPFSSYVHRIGIQHQKTTKKKRMYEAHHYIINKLKSGKYF